MYYITIINHYFKKQAIYYLLLICLCVGLTSCQQGKVCDSIIKNAIVYTVDSAFSQAQSIAITNGKIVGVGSNQYIEKNFISQNNYDAQGKFVYPGFNDAHSHFYGLGLSKQIVNLTNTSSWEDCIKKAIDFYKTQKPKYILARGWDQNDWTKKVMPNADTLNILFPDIPVILRRIDGHAAVANNIALKAANINEGYSNNGGKAIKVNGKLTGLLIDNAAEDVMKAIPSQSQESIEKALAMAQKECLSWGLCSVTDGGLGQSEIEVIKKMQEQGKLQMRLDVWLSYTPENWITYLQQKPFRSDRLNIATLKLYSDGAMGSRGACMTEPYHDDPHNFGMIITPPDSIDKWLEQCYAMGFQVATHSIGDSAVRLMLDKYNKVLQEPNKRWRIEHAQVVHPNDMQKFKDKGIIPSVQPTHATSDMYWAKERLGETRIQYAYAYKQLLNQNGWLPLGTDFPVEKVSPLLTFYAATYRRDAKNYPKDGFNVNEALSRKEALQGITIWAAKASFDEDIKGSIEVGKVADFTILDRDIMTIPYNEILEAKVLKTIINGKVVFEQ